MKVEVRVPTLGESVIEATVSTWFKKTGDVVQSNEMLCELETEKVTVEVPSPSAGLMSELAVSEGDIVGVDALLAVIESSEPNPRNLPTIDTFSDLPEKPEEAVIEIYTRVSEYFDHMSEEVLDYQRDAILKTIVACEELGTNCVFQVDTSVLFEDELSWSSVLLQGVNDLREAVRKHEVHKKVEELRKSFRRSRGVTADGFSEEGKVELNQSINSLKEIITNHPFSDRRKKYLLRKLDELKDEIHSSKATCGSMLAKIGVIGAVLAASTSFLADSPQALETVGKVVALITSESSEDEELAQITKEPELLKLPPPDQ